MQVSSVQETGTIKLVSIPSEFLEVKQHIRVCFQKCTCWRLEESSWCGLIGRACQGTCVIRSIERRPSVRDALNYLLQLNGPSNLGTYVSLNA